MKAFALTHIGLVRKRNEDRYLIKEMADGSVLLAVADGMGGEVAGDFAAEIVKNKLSSIQPNSKNKEQQLALLVEEADRAIMDEVKKDPVLEGMGTTVTGVSVCDGLAHWVHVGDSRLYVVRDHELIQVTKDQNMAQFLQEEGEISAEEARTHPSQNLLDQCVGCGSCEPETGWLDIKAGDLLILTTDGLHGEVTTETMASLLTFQTNIETKAKSLIQAALDAGGKDNITIIVAEI